MKKRDFLSCSWDEAKNIWEKACDGAQDIPDVEGAESEAILIIQTNISNLLKERFEELL